MTEPNDFNTDRDRIVGAWLREHWDTSDDAAFAAGVMARVAQERRETSWDVLASWAPLGMAAAALLALATGLGLGLTWRGNQPEVVDTGDPVEWLSTTDLVTTEFVLTAVLSGDGNGANGDQ